MPSLKLKMGPDRLVAAASAGTAVALALFGLAHEPVVALIASFSAGISWIAVVATLKRIRPGFFTRLGTRPRTSNVHHSFLRSDDARRRNLGTSRSHDGVAHDALRRRRGHASCNPALHRLRKERLRDGAYRWGIFEDTGDPGRFLETFLVESWTEHLRQHERVTNADHVLQQYVSGLLTGEAKVTHLITPS
jgi:hypothetical protein